LQYYNEAVKAVDTLLKNVPAHFREAFVSRHKLVVQPEVLLEDPSVWVSAREAYFSRLPEKCETPEDLLLLIGSDANKNLSLIARFFSAVTQAGRAEFIVDSLEDEFRVMASDDGDLELTCPKQILRRVQKLEEDVLSISRDNAMVCMPVISDKTVMGYIYLYAGHRFHKINTESLNVCKRLVPLTALNFHQLIVKDGAYIDRLTGVLNAKAFDMEFDKIIRSVRDLGGSFSLAICDLDKFKSINDTFGHQAGDDILRAVGRLFRINLPERAVVGRIGGDEFAVLFNACTAQESVAAMDYLRKSIANSMLLGSKRAVTISAGIATYGLHDDSKTGLKELADKALYVCKEHGRNQITLYDPSFLNGKSRIHHALDGIVSNDALRDSERIRFLLGLIELLRIKASSEEKRRIILSRMTEILHGETGVWLKPSNRGFIPRETAFSVSSGFTAETAPAGYAVWDGDIAGSIKLSLSWELHQNSESGVISLYAPVIKEGAVTDVICITQKPGVKPFSYDDGKYLQYLCGFAGAV
jgi:diguanylate cyclase (GGDEF)-like protein